MTALFTLAQLKAAGACSEQVELFVFLFGDSVNVTPARARKVADKFDWFFAGRFLDAEGQAECRRVKDQARAEYRRVTGPAWAEYLRVNGSAWAEYERVLLSAQAEFERVTGPAWASAYIATCKRAKEAAK